MKPSFCGDFIFNSCLIFPRRVLIVENGEKMWTLFRDSALLAKSHRPSRAQNHKVFTPFADTTLVML